MTNMTPEQLAARVAELETEKTALKTKNSELIDREKEAKKRADDAETATLSDLDKAIKRAEQAEAALEESKALAETNAKSLREYKATNAITAAITAANVDNSHVPLLTKAFRAEVEFSESGEPLIAGKPIDQHIKSFVSKEGAVYVRVADHNGGGATGSEGTKASRMTKENFNYTKFAQIQLENPEEANAIAIEVGRPNLVTKL